MTAGRTLLCHGCFEPVNATDVTDTGFHIRPFTRRSRWGVEYTLPGECGPLVEVECGACVDTGLDDDDRECTECSTGTAAA